jgi:hypothetical protein
VAREVPELRGRFAVLPGVVDVASPSPGTYAVRTDGEEASCERVAAAAVAAGAGVIELTRERASLEEVFLDLVTEEPGEGMP